MISSRAIVLTTTEIVATDSPAPVSRNRKTSARLTRKTANCNGASAPCTTVHRVWSRRARSSGEYRGLFFADAGRPRLIGPRFQSLRLPTQAGVAEAFGSECKTRRAKLSIYLDVFFNLH